MHQILTVVIVDIISKYVNYEFLLLAEDLRKNFPLINSNWLNDKHREDLANHLLYVVKSLVPSNHIVKNIIKYQNKTIYEILNTCEDMITDEYNDYECDYNQWVNARDSLVSILMVFMESKDVRFLDFISEATFQEIDIVMHRAVRLL
jgi:hypothetical protein